MEAENQTRVREFLFLGFSSYAGHQAYLFLLFLTAYSATVMGNLLIILLVLLDSRLHSPMYFFIGQLSCLDICLSSVVVPKILLNFLRRRHSISYNQCLAQTFFLVGFAGCEPALLAVMAFDRYAAICQPLRYASLMSHRVCRGLVVATWVWGFLDAAVHACLTSLLSFCGVNQIPHIFCDVPPLLKIACSDTHVNELTNHITSVFVGFCPLMFIFISYCCILSSILQLRSGTGSRKAFSTCGSHLAAVAIYLCNAFLNYNPPRAGYSLEVDTLVSSMFSVFTPMLNPLIYSLRNKEVKAALRKVLNSLRAASH